MNRYSNNKKNKKSNIKDQIIIRQVDEIESLKKKVFDLKIDCEEKDKVIHSIDTLRNNLLNITDDLRKKCDEYDKLIAELNEMKNAMNQIVFNKKWKLIRLLLK